MYGDVREEIEKGGNWRVDKEVMLGMIDIVLVI